MAYRYNNNRGYNKKNYNNNNRNNYNRRNDDRPQNDRKPAQSISFDGRKYKKPDIPIWDMNGNYYMISGNFSDNFILDSFADYKRINSLLNLEQPTIESALEVYNTLVAWIARFLNFNTEGATYTEDHVKANFGSMLCMRDLFKSVIGNRLNDWAKELDQEAKDADYAMLEKLQKEISKRENEAAQKLQSELDKRL